MPEQANCMHGAFLSIDENVLSMWWSHFVPETTMWDISFSRKLPSTNKCYLFEYKGKISLLSQLLRSVSQSDPIFSR
jgi:hypothetical protein